MAIEVPTTKVKKDLPRKKGNSKPKKDGFRRFKQLECFDEMDMRIKAGISLDEVARWLQDDMFQCTDIQHESLKRQLYRYKASLPPAELLKAHEEPLFVRKAIEKMKRGIDEIEELEKLYLFQLRRISKDGETEDKINKLFKGTNKEIELATTLLEKMVKLKMELGLLDKQPEKMQFDGLIGHVPVEMPGEDPRDVDKKMTRMGLIASKLFKAVETMSTEEESAGLEHCDEVKH